MRCITCMHEMHHLQSCASELGSQQSPLIASSSSSGEHALLSTSTSTSNDDHVSLDVRDKPLVTNEIEANALTYIEGNDRLRVTLADWQSRLKESQERKERKYTLSWNVKNEIYHLIGFFSVFQGAVLTTVSQASQLTCHTWCWPFALSLLASAITLFAVCSKFHNFIKWKRATNNEAENSKVLKIQISRLKKYGADFKFPEHAPDVPHKTRKELGQSFKRYYILAVLGIVSMVGFSVIMLVSCQRILCDQGPSHCVPWESLPPTSSAP